LQVGDTGPVESARRSNSRVLGSPFSGLSGQGGWKFDAEEMKPRGQIRCRIFRPDFPRKTRELSSVSFIFRKFVFYFYKFVSIFIKPYQNLYFYFGGAIIHSILFLAGKCWKELATLIR
jgi:hypothetical protein